MAGEPGSPARVVSVELDGVVADGRIRTSGASRSVSIPSMGDADNLDPPIRFIGAVDDAVRPQASASKPVEFVSQRHTDAPRRIEQRPRDQLNGSDSNCLRKPFRKICSCWPRDYEVVWRRIHLGRSALTASTPRTTSPSSKARRPSAISAIASGSDRIASVSSIDSRSSGLMRTAAGVPLRVMTIRSWWLWTRSTKSEKRSLTVLSDSVVMGTIVPRIIRLPGRGRRARCQRGSPVGGWRQSNGGSALSTARVSSSASSAARSVPMMSRVDQWEARTDDRRA